MKKPRVAAPEKSPRRPKRAQTSKSKGRGPEVGDLPDAGRQRADENEPLVRLSGSQCPELDDVVDIASKESFPASDPPAYLPLHI